MESMLFNKFIIKRKISTKGYKSNIKKRSKLKMPYRELSRE